MTLQILDALCGWSVFNNCPLFGLSLRVAFFGLLRTGELLSLRAKDIFIPGPKGPAVLSLGLTKGGARQGAAESVTLHERSILPIVCPARTRTRTRTRTETVIQY